MNEKFGPGDSYLRQVRASEPPVRMTPAGPYKENPLAMSALAALHAQDVADERRAEAGVFADRVIGSGPLGDESHSADDTARVGISGAKHIVRVMCSDISVARAINSVERANAAACCTGGGVDLERMRREARADVDVCGDPVRRAADVLALADEVEADRRTLATMSALAREQGSIMRTQAADIARFRCAQAELVRIIGEAAKNSPETAEALIAMADVAIGKMDN